jgi:hypothetical protein
MTFQSRGHGICSLFRPPGPVGDPEMTLGLHHLGREPGSGNQYVQGLLSQRGLRPDLKIDVGFISPHI